MSRFQDIIGQEQIKEHLMNAISTGRVSHAYIINGERFSGKEFVARIFAMALQCEQEGIEPCHSCHSCVQTLSDNQPDIIYVTHEKPNTIRVDEIREQVNSDVAIKPYSSKYKIYIIREAEKMNAEAQNALLKTLEEPPAYAVIILLTSNLNDMLPTILSRCVVLNIKPVADHLIKKYLCEEVCVPDYKAQVCVAFARGNLGRAKLLATSEEFDNIKADAVFLLKYIHEMELSEMMAAVKKMTEYKVEVADYLDICAMWYRDVLLYKATKDANHLVFQEEIQTIRAVAKRTGYEGLDSVIAALETAKKRLAANVNFELTMELLFLTMQENG